ncbi:site-specific integrase [Leptolyngbya sp. FACHB-321]|uniref:tyrosine-type recombinase/integrase n=1 Tax=Leptolyngbya sp. FACHB-321 TaxID=2692807 RepID=UPI001682D3FB|nr:tyrosine-type recombinase/integrase [Leptolyngbya sp. FACHB-321]MBD2037752.1 site-specific integrase [Leptolyngbya sp. FACHB-321]
MTTQLSEALAKYEAINGKRETGEVRSIINLYILRALLITLGLEELQHRKLKYVLDQITLAGFVALADPIFNEALLLMTANHTRKVRKSKWKRFCNWLLQQDWYLPDPLPREIIAIKNQFNTHIPKGTYTIVTALKREKEAKEKEAKQLLLRESDWTPRLREEFQAFDRFYTTVNPWRKKVVRPTTLKSWHNAIASILGFQRNRETPLDQLSLQQLLDLSVLKDYETWSREKGNSSLSIKTVIAVAIPVAKWSFNQSFPGEDWRNSEAVKTAKGYVKAVPDLQDRPHASDEAFEARAISIEQCWEVLKYLGWRCKDLERQHGVTREVIDAWMDYFLLAILITTGGRQREARELTFQKLSLEGNGEILVELTPEGHKTGSKTDKGRVYPLFVGPIQQELNADFFYYRDYVRPQNLGHDYAFFMRESRTIGTQHSLRGDPIASHQYLSNLVPRTVAVTTAHLYGFENAKWTAPHDFRRIIATWVCTYGSPEHLAIYAELLGHDVSELIKRYNKMHPGKLARQAGLAYKDIAANEARVKEWQSPGSSPVALSVAQMNPPALIAMLKKLVKKLWNALSPRKRATVFESLSAAEREVLDE